MALLSILSTNLIIIGSLNTLIPVCYAHQHFSNGCFCSSGCLRDDSRSCPCCIIYKEIGAGIIFPYIFIGLLQILKTWVWWTGALVTVDTTFSVNYPGSSTIHFKTNQIPISGYTENLIWNNFLCVALFENFLSVITCELHCCQLQRGRLW